MRTLRFGALAVAAALVLANVASAQRQPGQPGQPGGRLQFGARPLLSGEDMDKLKLSSDQKNKVEKIVKDYDDKAKATTEKMRELFAKAREPGQDGPSQELRDKATALFEESRKTRTEAVDKLKTVLNDEQKKTFEELQQRRPGGPGGGAFPPGGFGGGFGPVAPGQVLPRAIQDRLELTAEQKEKVANLQKDVEAQLKKILTEEQNKKLEELKQGGGRPGRPGGAGGGQRPPSQ